MEEFVVINLQGHVVPRRTFDLAHAAAADAATRQMRAHGRQRWNEQDWDLAIDTMDRLLGNTAPQAAGKKCA